MAARSAIRLLPVVSLLLAGQAARGNEAEPRPAPPLAEVCLLPDDMLGNTCAAFFLREDGYEICLKDDMSGRIRCSSSFGAQDGEEDRPPEHHRSPRTEPGETLVH